MCVCCCYRIECRYVDRSVWSVGWLVDWRNECKAKHHWQSKVVGNLFSLRLIRVESVTQSVRRTHLRLSINTTMMAYSYTYLRTHQHTKEYNVLKREGPTSKGINIKKKKKKVLLFKMMIMNKENEEWKKEKVKIRRNDYGFSKKRLPCFANVFKLFFQWYQMWSDDWHQCLINSLNEICWWWWCRSN